MTSDVQRLVVGIGLCVRLIETQKNLPHIEHMWLLVEVVAFLLDATSCADSA